jgi:hypothetical protein
VVISVSSVWKGLHPFHERVPTFTTDPANFLDSSASRALVIVNRMWWRALGVAAVLLCVGVAGGYAFADRNQEEPARSRVLEPVPGVSPAVPTPTVFTVLPDPTAPALGVDLPSHEETLRMSRRGAGITLAVPDGWRLTQLPNSLTWTGVPEINTTNTYTMRVRLMIGQQQAVTVAKSARLDALESAVDQGNMFDLHVTAEADDYIEANYIVDNYRRVTMEKWVGNDDGIAYADVAVTGRTVDTEGLRDLLTRTVESVAYVDQLPPREKP